MLIDIYNHIIETDEIDRIYPIKIVDDRPTKNEITYKVVFQLKTTKGEVSIGCYMSKLPNKGSDVEIGNELLAISQQFKNELCNCIMDSKRFHSGNIQTTIPKLAMIYPEKKIPEKKLVENPKSIAEIAAN